MKRRLFSILFSVLSIAALPSASIGQVVDNEERPPDARFMGYANDVRLPEESGALTWVLFLIMSVVGLSVMFKNSKRTHLD